MPGLPELEKRVDELEQKFKIHNHSNVLERLQKTEEIINKIKRLLEIAEE